ncbi:hypothetical protein ACF0H5_003372 [Mactra antiquata]
MDTKVYGNVTNEWMNYSVTSGNKSEQFNLLYLNQYNNEAFIYNLPAIIYTGIMMMLGLPGNMIVFYIYFFKWRRSTSRIFILFLAALDSLNCGTTLPMEIYIMRNTLKLDHPFLCKLSRYSTYTLNCSSALILLGIAADRFKRICRPYQRAFSEGQSKKICLAAIIFSMATTWASLILYGTRKLDLGETIGYTCLLENRFDHSIYPIVFFGYMVTSTMLIFATLIILYYFIGLQIYKHRQFKLKNCTHVQKFVDEKSFTDKGFEKSKTSSNENGQNRPCEKESPEEKNMNIITVDKATSVEFNQQNMNDHHLNVTTPLPDVGTSCGYLDVPNNPDKDILELPSSHVSFDSRATCEQMVNDQMIDSPSSPKKSQPSNKERQRKRKRRVRYMLVRGSSTLNASGRTRCVNCLTVRVGKSTLMLFLITIVYVVSFLPFYVIIIVRQLDKSFLSGMSRAGTMAYHVFLRSYLLSSASNPFVYSFCNTQFRELCKETFVNIFYRHKTQDKQTNLFRRSHR